MKSKLMPEHQIYVLLAFSVSIPSPLLQGLSLIASPPTLCSSPNPSLLLLVRHRQNRRRRMIMRSVRHPRRFPGADGSCASPGILTGILLFCVQRSCSPVPQCAGRPVPPCASSPVSPCAGRSVPLPHSASLPRHSNCPFFHPSRTVRPSVPPSLPPSLPPSVPNPPQAPHPPFPSSSESSST